MSAAYPHLDSLVDLACRDGVDIRPTLLRVITDLYVQKPVHSSEEETQYVELALGLIDAVDATTRAIVAARLHGYRGAPQTVLRRLDATTAAGEGDAGSGATVAPLPAALVDEFFAAAADKRRLILTDLGASEPALANPLAAPAGIISRLETAALQRNSREFARLLAPALGVSVPLAERIVEDASGEPVVVAAKALGMKAAVLQRVLLVLNPKIGQSVERVFSLALLYDEISPAAAARMVASWRAVPARPRPQHAPLYWDDRRIGARTAATPAPHRVARGGDSAPGRARTRER